MNKNDVSEIKKQIKGNAKVLRDVWCCYVDGEKNKVFTLREPLDLLTDDKADEYYARLKKTLSGSVGKQLLNLEFTQEQELEGGKQADLFTLYKSKLEEPAMVEAFFDRIIESFTSMDNLYIMLAFGTYDVPGYSSNGEALEEVSENVYDFMLCSICPVVATRPFLAYDAMCNDMENKSPEMQVGMPLAGFLYPTFNDRTGDIHSVLYYTSKPTVINYELIDQLFGCDSPLTTDKQKEAFQDVIMNSSQGKPDFESMSSIHEQICDIVAGNETPDTVMLDKRAVTEILKNAGADEAHIEAASQAFDDHLGAVAEVPAENLIDIKKLQIKADGVDIRVSSQKALDVETRVIDGRKCVMVYVDDPVELNGVPVRIHNDEAE